MARSKECPKCGKDISDTYEPADFSIGIMGQGWYCDDCDIAVDDDSDPDDYAPEYYEPEDQDPGDVLGLYDEREQP